MLDEGSRLFQWQGESAGIFEKNKAAEIVREMDDSRKDVDIEVLEGYDCALGLPPI